MKISEHWLREWVDPAIDADALVAQLSMAGLEVDSAEPAAPPFSDVVVGEVLAVEPHPDADKLRLCRVADGTGEHAVVCGAPNVVAGMKAPYARVGAQLPDGMKIRKAKLRGVESFGMLCGADELGLADERDGLMELPADLETGADLRAVLGLDDVLIDIDLTPNRGDCLGLRGLAREVGVLNDVPVSEPAIEPVPATIDDTFPVTVSHAEGCPRYLGRVIRGVDVTRPTPTWMVEKLRRCGLRSIDPVVDVTNYVLLELGQPMHAFDLNRLTGGIDVRLPKPGERVVLLDGSDVAVDADTLLITDADGPVALAGIMGGERSGIVAEGGAPTTDIFLECAFFSPVAVAGRARRYGLQTDASHRYERGVDFELQHLATERATQLLLDIVGGEAGPVTEWLDEAVLPTRERIRLREARLARVLGMRLEADVVEGMLERLGLPIAEREETDAGRVWTVTAPSFRFDLEREADLIEEVARIHGYDNVDVRMPAARMHLLPTEERVLDAEAVRDALVGWGGQEILSYSFVDPAIVEALAPGAETARLANPLSADLAVMRPSLWPGLVKTWIANRNRQQDRARLFEIGRTFGPVGATGAEERTRVALLLAGTRAPEAWGTTEAEVDFFDARGAVERLIALTRDADAFRFERGEHPVLHPGQTARLVRTVGGRDVEAGVVGRIHPRVQAALDLPKPVFLVDLDLDVLADRGLPAHAGLSRYPQVRRDVAIELDAAIPAADVLATVKAAGGDLVRDVRLFDVYEGERLGAGRRSLALGVVLQHPERTLEDAETNETVDAIVAALAESHGAVRR
jgi:phenylalanyl-tRNA synthetase beta chain